MPAFRIFVIFPYLEREGELPFWGLNEVRKLIASTTASMSDPGESIKGLSERDNAGDSDMPKRSHKVLPLNEKNI